MSSLYLYYYMGGLAAFISVIVLMTRQRRNVNTFLQQNKNVTPLLLQKATQLKLNNIKQSLDPNSDHYLHTKARLDELTTRFRNETIDMHTYNIGLDDILEQINKKCPVV